MPRRVREEGGSKNISIGSDGPSYTGVYGAFGGPKVQRHDLPICVSPA